VNNVRCESSRTFRNKEGKYQKDKINELETYIKNKIIETYTEA
jgi:hypothetical protein